MLQNGGGISVVKWRTLWDRYEVGPMTISDLASTQRTDHSQLSRALPKMRKMGLVPMRHAAQNGRQTIVTLTDKGRDAYYLAAPIVGRRRDALGDVSHKPKSMNSSGIWISSRILFAAPPARLLKKTNTMTKRPNVLRIIVDQLRLDYLSGYGLPAPTFTAH